MNEHLTLGLFAFAVVVISLVRILGEQEFFRLKEMKRCWGRKVGLLLHFLTNVGLPLVVGIVFFCRGIVGFSPAGLDPSAEEFSLDISALRSADFTSEASSFPASMPIVAADLAVQMRNHPELFLSP